MCSENRRPSPLVLQQRGHNVTDLLLLSPFRDLILLTCVDTPKRLEIPSTNSFRGRAPGCWNHFLALPPPLRDFSSFLPLRIQKWALVFCSLCSFAPAKVTPPHAERFAPSSSCANLAFGFGFFWPPEGRATPPHFAHFAPRLTFLLGVAEKRNSRGEGRDQNRGKKKVKSGQKWFNRNVEGVPRGESHTPGMGQDWRCPAR